MRPGGLAHAQALPAPGVTALALSPDRAVDVSYRETCVPDAGEKGVVSIHVTYDHGHWTVEHTLAAGTPGTPSPGAGWLTAPVNTSCATRPRAYGPGARTA